MASELLYHLVTNAATQYPAGEALKHKKVSLTYTQLAAYMQSVAAGLQNIGLSRFERVAIYLPKCFENVLTCFGSNMAGGVFVPVNPLLKAPQVTHILKDCNARILVTASTRLEGLAANLSNCHDLQTIILIDDRDITEVQATLPNITFYKWDDIANSSSVYQLPPTIDVDMASILYTSGSTGKPKGVVLSHKNIVTGAKSVSSYLENTASDRILAVLPFSFDYGFSQMTTAFYVGASVVLMDYLLPRDIIRALERESITGLAAVPPLWNKLAELDWPESISEHLRYMTNSGGAMPKTTLASLRQASPKTKFYLMYGLTEAFRSTYLQPDEIDRRPDSMGKAIPNAEIMVVREDGSPCAPGEPGELVHRGSLVAMGYWNDPNKTAERFRPAPLANPSIPFKEIAVWSGDTVKMDEQGYLYFISRKDEMIKTSGYRVSPTEVEEVIYTSGLIGEAIALGVSHPELGQAILLIVTPNKTPPLDTEALSKYCKQELPGYMVPAAFIERETLPRNPNGKIDRKLLANEYGNHFNQKK